MRILLAEDDRAISGAVKKRLTAEGYAVDVCENGRDAYDYMQATAYDVVLMDIMMPGEDGLSVVRRARAQGMDTPILFLTARDSVDDRVTGLDAGGDDYLVKPFALSELLARIRVLARRGGTRRAASAIDVGDLDVDTASRQVTRAGRRIDLTAREYALLELLMRNRGVVLYRDVLFERVWGPDSESDMRTLDLHIRRLRMKLGWQKQIRTVFRVGYELLNEDDLPHGEGAP